MQISLSASASKAHKQFLASPQALAEWGKGHRKAVRTESREVSKFMKIRKLLDMLKKSYGSPNLRMESKI